MPGDGPDEDAKPKSTSDAADDRSFLDLFELLDDDTRRRLLDADDDQHTEIITTTARHQVPRRLASWRSNAARDVDAMEARQARFQHRIAEWPWGPALRELDLLWAVTVRVAKGYTARRGPGAIEAEDVRFAACALLHRRALRVTAEIRALMRAGFASGAMARWRTLHELTVVVSFIHESDQDTAQRYFDHEAIMRSRSLKELYRAGPAFADQLPPSDELEELHALEADLIARYGPGFAGRFGWARKALRTSGDPELGDLERATKLSHWRPYVDLAHGPMHAGARAMIFDLGTPHDDVGTVIGSSNLGMADPGQCAALSLIACTAAWLAVRPDFRALVDMQALSELSRGVVDAFFAAETAHRDAMGDHEEEAEP